MDAFSYTEKMARIFTGDEPLRRLLKAGEPKNMRAFASKFRRRDQEVDEFEPKDLNFIAFYFADANATGNAYMNKGLLRIEIYTKTRSETGKIRERIVHLMHEHFDQRVCAEGQRVSGIKDIYKYRLEFMPLIFN